MSAKSVVKVPVRVQLCCDPLSRTHQSFKDTCDIRNIMRQFRRTGLLSHVNSAQGQYADFSSVPDYQEAMNIVVQSQTAFDALPSAIRKRFGNDPAAFLDFVGDASNTDEMIKLGLMTPPVSAPIVALQEGS